jgi:hypothetical protein
VIDGGWSSGPEWDLHCGRWQDAMSHVREVGAVITDPPYSARTEAGQRGNRTSAWLGSPKHSAILYGSLTRDDVFELVRSWAPRTRRWFVMFGDHLTVQWALEALDEQGWYHFPPLTWAKRDAAPRIMADGPSPQSEFIAVARPRRRLATVEKRYRPGWYTSLSRPEYFKGTELIGSKPEFLMRAIVRDYSEPGDLIADPFCGLGSTAFAARAEGRRCVTAEVDPATYEKARKRLSAPFTAPLFTETAGKAEQLELGGEEP